MTFNQTHDTTLTHEASFSMTECIDILERGTSKHLVRALRNKIVTLEQAITLFKHALQRIITYFEVEHDVDHDMKHVKSMLLELTQLLPENVCCHALNQPVLYGMSYLERICILHDTVACEIAPILMNMGGHPLRTGAFSNAVHRCLESGNIQTLVALKNHGLLLEGVAAQKALECATICSVTALKVLFEHYKLDFNTVLADGGTILHRIARDRNTEQALLKIDYCAELGLANVTNHDGLFALDVAKRWGECRVCTRMETYFHTGIRPLFNGIHPFLTTAEALSKQSSPAALDLSNYLKKCAKWGLRGEHRIYKKTGYGVGAIALEFADRNLLEAAFLEGETVNTIAPEGASLLGYAAVLYHRQRDQRHLYTELFDLLLKQPNADWDMYDQDGTSVRTWVENALFKQKDRYLEAGTQRMLEASNTARLAIEHRVC